MADMGEDREIRQRVNANQAERVAEAKKLAEKLRSSPARTTPRKSKKRVSQPKPRT
jgi:hypothetical protein